MKLKYFFPYERLTALSYSDYQIFKTNKIIKKISNTHAIMRLKEAYRENNTRFLKEKGHIVWNAPNILYGMSIEGDKISIIELYKKGCFDKLYQAFFYKSSNEENIAILYDDVIYEDTKEVDESLYNRGYCLFAKKEMLENFIKEYGRT